MILSIQILGRKQSQRGRRPFFARAAVVLAGLLVLNGCGQKGPLFLPVMPSGAVQAAPEPGMTAPSIPASAAQ